jgi:hypothetical protein
MPRSAIYCFQVSVAQFIRQIPSHAQNDDLLIKVAALEQRRGAFAELGHGVGLSFSAQFLHQWLMNLGSQRIMKMGCVAREPLHGLVAQLREAAIFEGEPLGLCIL